MIKKFLAKMVLLLKLSRISKSFDLSYSKMESTIHKNSKSEYIIKHTLLK